MSRHARLRSLPPKGTRITLGTARQVIQSPHARLRSLPPAGAQITLGTARQVIR